MADASAAGASAPAVINSSEVPVTPNGTTDGRAVTPQEIRKHKLKVNQREVELDDEQYRIAAQKGLASDETFRKAAEKDKQIAAYFERAKNGDLGWLEDIVGEEAILTAAEKRLMRKIEFEELTPQQREALQWRQRAEQAEGKLTDAEKREEQIRRAQLTQEAYEHIDVEIDEAFKAIGRKPTPRLVMRVAEEILASLPGTQDDEGRAPIPAATALQRATSGVRTDAAELLASMSPAELREFLPKEALDALRKLDLEDVRGPNAKRPTLKPLEGKTDAKRKRMSTDAMFAQLEQKFGG